MNYQHILAGGLYHSGLLGAVRRMEKSHLVVPVVSSRFPRLRCSKGSKFGILCYHRVGTSGIPLFSRLDPGTFAAQMRYISKNYRVVPLGQLCHELREERDVEPTLAVTFDDGYQDLYRYAYPVLQKYGIPATIYLIGACMETGEAPWYDRIFVAMQSFPDSSIDVEMDRSAVRLDLSSPAARFEAAWKVVCYLRTIPDPARRRWCTELEHRYAPPASELSDRMLDWRQVRLMSRSGISFGAHTMTHPAVSRLAPSTLAEELVGSKRVLENGLDAAIEDFAYPFGKPADIGPAAGRLLQQSGYRSAVTTCGGHNTSATNLYQLRRIQIGEGRSVSSFAFDISRMFLEDVEPLVAAPVEHRSLLEPLAETVTERGAE